MASKNTKHLIIIGHPDKKSFCHNGIFKTVVRQMKRYSSNYRVIDLYDDKLHRNKKELIKEYRDLVTWSTHLYFISPVWWFRLTPKLEMFFDEVLTPGFAYKFVPLIGKYAYPKSFLISSFTTRKYFALFFASTNGTDQNCLVLVHLFKFHPNTKV